MDPQFVSVIAATTIGIVSSYLAKAGESAAKKVGEDIYQVVKDRFHKKPGAQEVLADLEKNPTNTDLQAASRVQLAKMINEDKTFGAQLQNLLHETSKTETGSVAIKQIAGDNAKQFGQVFGNITFGPD